MRAPGDGGSRLPGDALERARSATSRVVPDLLRERFSLKVGVLVFAVMLVVSMSGGVIFVQADAAIQRSTETQLESVAQQQAGTITEWDRRMRSETASAAKQRAMQEREYGQLDEVLRQRLTTLPGYVAAIHVVGTGNATVLASTSSDAEGTDYSETDAPWTDQLTFVGADNAIKPPTYEDPVVGGPTVAYVAQVQNRPEAAIVLLVDLEARSGELSRTASGADTVVVDGDGRVVMHQNTDRIGQQYTTATGSESVAVQRGMDGETGYAEGTVRGDSMAMGYSPVASAQWVVLTQLQQGQASGAGSLILTSIVGMVLVASLALLAVAVVIGRGTAGDITRLAATAKQLEAGDLDAECSTGRDDELGDLYRSFDSMRTTLKARIQEAEQARQAAEQAREESEALTRHLEQQAEQYSDVMQSVADGDFTARLDPESHSQAMREIAVAFNTMVNDIENVVRETKTFADEVAASSEEVTASSEEVEASAQQVAETIQGISDGAERQDRQLQTVAEEMNTLSTTIEEIAASADEVAGVAAETADVGETGRESAERAIEEMRTVEREAQGTVDAMDDLQDRIGEIEEVTEFITDVAEQTNILALNANIEAARAGEAGAGFAVVADQVKELAEETREAAEDIEGHVRAVQDQTQVTAQEVQTTSEVVGDTADIVEEAADALEEIATYAEETNVGIQEISDGTSEQATSTNEVVSVVDDVADIAERTAEESGTVAAATEEQTAALSEMTGSASRLTAEADQLKEMLERFETASPAAQRDAETPADDD